LQCACAVLLLRRLAVSGARRGRVRTCPGPR
jgi:hypothetical protein